MRVPSTLAMLGKGLDLRYVSHGKETKVILRGLAMASSEDGRTLYFVPMPSKSKPLRAGSYAKAADVRRRWSEMEPGDARTTKIRTAKDQRLGVLSNIGYWSDKWGKKEHYTHDSHSGAVVTVSGNVYRVRGGRLRVTPRGIEG